MAKFIEVAPIDCGTEGPKMLINTENISYAKEIDEVATLLFLKEVPVNEWTEKPEFKNHLIVKMPFVFVSDVLLEKEEIKNRKGKMVNGTFVKEEDL